MSARRVFILSQALKKFIGVKTSEDFEEAKAEAKKALAGMDKKVFDPHEKIRASEVYTLLDQIVIFALNERGPHQTRDILSGVGMKQITQPDRVRAGLILKAAGFQFINRYDKNRGMPVKKWVIKWEFKSTPIDLLIAMAKQNLKEKIQQPDKKLRFESLI